MPKVRDTEPNGGVIFLADDWIVVPGRWWTVNIYRFCRWVGSFPLLRMKVFHVLTECIFGVGKNVCHAWLDHAFSVYILWHGRCCTSACCCRRVGKLYPRGLPTLRSWRHPIERNAAIWTIISNNVNVSGIYLCYHANPESHTSLKILRKYRIKTTYKSHRLKMPTVT